MSKDLTKKEIIALEDELSKVPEKCTIRCKHRRQHLFIS